MTTINDAWQAGIDAVVADNTLARAGFRDAIKTVLTAGVSNSELTAWIDAVATEFNRLGLINNPTYNNLRGNIIADAVAHRALFDALGATINGLAESEPATTAARLIDLRADRDAANDGIDRLDVLIGLEPGGAVGRLVKDVLRQGKQAIRAYKETVRTEIHSITGDPDS